MHDLCLCQDWTEAEDQAHEETTTLLPLLSDFACDLACSLDLACADTIPATEFFGSPKHRWKCREIQLWTQFLTNQIEEQTFQPQELALILTEIKQLIRAIDI